MLFQFVVVFFTPSSHKTSSFHSSIYKTKKECHMALFDFVSTNEHTSPLIEPNTKDDISVICENLVDKLEWSGVYMVWDILELYDMLQFSIYKFGDGGPLEPYFSAIHFTPETYYSELLEYWNTDSMIQNAVTDKLLTEQKLSFQRHSSLTIATDRTRAMDYYKAVTGEICRKYDIKLVVVESPEVIKN